MKKNVAENIKGYVIVNATALSTGGALTILRQFISYAALSGKQYIIFTPIEVVLDTHPNLTYIEVDTRSWFRRIRWDAHGIKQYINKHKLNCSLCISLQNTSVNVDCQLLIYLHQPLPFTALKYKFSKNTAKYFLYKWFYKFFIFLFCSKDTRFVVQTQWMKAALIQNGVAENKVSVFFPDIILPTGYEVVGGGGLEKPVSQPGHAIFFYPASSLFYKNHLLILDALSMLKTRQLNRKPIFAVTLELGAYPAFDDKVKQLELFDYIAYLGTMSYKQVIEQYMAADAVLFPSFIETFGLPLAEAGVLGKKIICADLPYSRDVLADFQGATFLGHQNPYLWADEMALVIQRKSMFNYPPLSFSQYATWHDFFDFI